MSIEEAVDGKLVQHSHTISHRYRELIALDSLLQQIKEHDTVLAFPPKTWFGSVVNINDVQCRNRAFVQYFSQVVSDPQILAHDKFHEAISSPAVFIDAMKRTAKGITEQAKLTLEQRHVEAHFPRSRSSSVYEHSQHFLRNGNPILCFPIETTYVIQFAKDGQAIVREKTTNKAFFKVKRIKSTVPNRYSILNLENEILMFLKEDATFFRSKGFAISRLSNKSPSGSQSELTILKIEKEASLFGQSYKFQRINSRGCPELKCKGSLSDMEFKEHDNVVACFSRPLFSFEKTIEVSVRSGSDVLQYLGMAICLSMLEG